MGHHAMTLSRHLLTREHNAMSGTDMSLVVERIALVGKLIASELAHSAVVGGLGYSGETNIQGERQKKLDDRTNQIFLDVFDDAAPVCSLISEEMESARHFAHSCARNGTNYAVLFDPLDGSSNTDVNGSLGTIFSIRRRVERHGEDDFDLLEPGSKQVAAGYMVYGPSTHLVYTAGNGTHVFTLDPRVGEFLLWKDNIRMPPVGSYYAVNQANISKWHPGAQNFIHHITSRKDKRTSYSLRYCGALVSDFHRFLLEGGIYLYPGEVTSDGKSKGKLRLMYELAPLAMVAEQAGGRASNGKRRIMDVVPVGIHDRQPVYIGSAAEVALAEEFHVEG